MQYPEIYQDGVKCHEIKEKFMMNTKEKISFLAADWLLEKHKGKIMTRGGIGWYIGYQQSRDAQRKKDIEALKQKLSVLEDQVQNQPSQVQPSQNQQPLFAGLSAENLKKVKEILTRYKDVRNKYASKQMSGNLTSHTVDFLNDLSKGISDKRLMKKVEDFITQGSKNPYKKVPSLQNFSQDSNGNIILS
jgi:hypothetical protein